MLGYRGHHRNNVLVAVDSACCQEIDVALHLVGPLPSPRRQGLGTRTGNTAGLLIPQGVEGFVLPFLAFGDESLAIFKDPGTEFNNTMR